MGTFHQHLKDHLIREGIDKHKINSWKTTDNERNILENFLAQSAWKRTKVALFIYTYMTMGLDSGGVERTNAVLAWLLDHKKCDTLPKTIEDMMLLKHYAANDEFGNNIINEVVELYIKREGGWRKIIQQFTGKAFRAPRSDIGCHHSYPSRVNRAITHSAQLQNTNIEPLIFKGDIAGHCKEVHGFPGEVYELTNFKSDNRDWSSLKTRALNCTIYPTLVMRTFMRNRTMANETSLLHCALLSNITKCTTAQAIYNRVVKCIARNIGRLATWCCEGKDAEELENQISMRMGSKFEPTKMEHLYLDTVLIALGLKVNARIYLYTLEQLLSSGNSVVEINTGSDTTWELMIKEGYESKCKLLYFENDNSINIDDDN